MPQRPGIGDAKRLKGRWLILEDVPRAEVVRHTGVLCGTVSRIRQTLKAQAALLGVPAHSRPSKVCE